MPNEDNKIVDMPIPEIDLSQIPDYPGKNIISPETIIMLSGMLFTYFAMQNGIDTNNLAQQVQKIDSEVITKINQYHQIVLGIIIAIINGGNFLFAKNRSNLYNKRAEVEIVNAEVKIKALEVRSRELAIKEREILMAQKPQQTTTIVFEDGVTPAAEPEEVTQ